MHAPQIIVTILLILHCIAIVQKACAGELSSPAAVGHILNRFLIVGCLIWGGFYNH